MTSITTINPSDLITDSRAVINTNFANLNTDKIETSYLDTDSTLAADSDSKIATQKAVKAHVSTQISTILSPGTVSSYAGTTAPSGWLLADGHNVSRTGIYANLYSTIGTTYGTGDGSTTFTLPVKKSLMNGYYFDASSSFSSNSNVTSASWSHVYSGGNGIVVVGISASGANITTPTFNGVSMTLIDNLLTTEIRWYYYLTGNLASGTYTIASTFSSGTVSAGAVSYCQIKQSSPIDANAVTSPGNVTSTTVTPTKQSPTNLNLVFAYQQSNTGTPTMTNALVRVTASNAGGATQTIIIGELLPTGTPATLITFGGSAPTYTGYASILPIATPIYKYDIIKY